MSHRLSARGAALLMAILAVGAFAAVPNRPTLADLLDEMKAIEGELGGLTAR
jgi:hypothetical protein